MFVYAMSNEPNFNFQHMNTMESGEGLIAQVLRRMEDLATAVRVGAFILRVDFVGSTEAYKASLFVRSKRFFGSLTCRGCFGC